MRALLTALTLAVLGLAALATGAWAQGEEPLRNPFDQMKSPDDNAAPGDGGGEEPPPTIMGEPLTPSDASADDEISRNFDKALGNYQGILQGEKSATIRNLDKRIEQNEKLLEKNQGKLDEYRRLTRQAKIDYTRQLLNLQSGLKSGRIGEEKYKTEARRLSDEYVFQMNQFEKDIVFYRQESEETGSRLGTLREEQRFHRVAESRSMGREKKEKPQPNALEELAIELGGAHQFQMHDIWDDEGCRFCRVR